MPRTHVQEWSILNSYGKLLAVRSWSHNSNYTTTQRRRIETLGIRADTVRFSTDTESRAKPLKPRVTRRMIPSRI